MYTRENYLDAKEEIKARLVRAIETAEEHNLEVRSRSSVIAEIDEELRKTGLEIFRVACSGGNVDEVKEKNLALMSRRRAELTALGYPEDYTEVHYTCSACRDSGFVGTRMCSCLKELLIMKNIRSSGMGNLIEKQSFDNFELGVYEGEDLARMTRNLELAKEYAENFAKRRGNLLFIGGTGTGKTHLSTAIAASIIRQGYDVLYDSVQNIIGDFETDKFKSGYHWSDPVAEKYLLADLLIIDDLGTEFTNQFTVSCLYNLLNTRQNRGLATIISTNLSAKELAGKYEGRIYSRIVGSDYTVLFFSGKDRRIAAK